MESGARPSLITPHEPLPRSASSEDPPIWEPTEQLPRPPPLSCSSHQPLTKAITAKQYKEISLLPFVLQQGAQNAGPLPLLPIELPSVKKLVAAGHASDSEGAVTSKIEAKKLAAAAAAAAATKTAPRGVVRSSKSIPEAEELESLLEETLGEEEDEFEHDQREENKHEEEKEVDAGGEAQLEINIEQALSTDTGTGSIKDRAILAALKTTGYESWEALTTQLSENAAAAAAHGGASSTRRKPRPKTAESIKLDQVINSSSLVYHPAFKKAYYAAKSALEKKETAKRKAQELEDHSSLVPRWSALTAADHTWFLKNEGHQLIGAEAERFTTLAAKFEAEKLEYWAAVDAEGRAHLSRYRHIGPRQGGQLDEDTKLKRKRVLETLPQFWKLRTTVDLHVEKDSITDKSTGGRGGLFSFKKELLRDGEAPTLLQLPSGTNLPGNKLYLPAQLSTEAGPRPGEAGAVYRKACTAELREDTLLAVVLENAAKILREESEQGVEKEDRLIGIDPSEVFVCATAGAMLCMLRSSFLQHSPAWQIPIDIVLNEATSPKKRIYLGTPVPTEKEPLRSKQQRLQKYAVLTEALAAQGQHKAKPSNAEPGPREAIYWLTTAGGGEGNEIPLCIRSHGRIQLQPKHTEEKTGEEKQEKVEEGKIQAETEVPLSAVLAISTEYLPDPDIEQDTPQELATWWAKLLITPGADSAAVAHVHVPSSKISHWKVLTEKEIAAEFASNFDLKASAKRSIDTILQNLIDLEPGKYVLKHDAGENAVQILKEVEKEEGEEEEVITREMAAGEEELYDLHASQATAGEIDTSVDPFIPPKWRPYREDVAQVPCTFPPEVQIRGRGGGGGGGGRRRQRKNIWQGDLDQVQHVATISKSEYASQLREEM